MQSEDTGMYMENMCEQEDYSFVQLAGIGKENGNITDIVKSIRQGIAFIQNKYHFKKTYLVGSSAGGHLALISAFAGSMPEMYGSTMINIDGVIALYSPVDLDYQYRYFVEENKAHNLSGKIGDMLYCKLFNGKTNTLGGETALLQESFFGKQLFCAIQIHGLLKFNNPDMSAVSFAMTIHALMDYKIGPMSIK